MKTYYKEISVKERNGKCQSVFNLIGLTFSFLKEHFKDLLLILPVLLIISYFNFLSLKTVVEIDYSNFFKFSLNNYSIPSEVLNFSPILSILKDIFLFLAQIVMTKYLYMLIFKREINTQSLFKKIILKFVKCLIIISAVILLTSFVMIFTFVIITFFLTQNNTGLNLLKLLFLFIPTVLIACFVYSILAVLFYLIPAEDYLSIETAISTSISAGTRYLPGIIGKNFVFFIIILPIHALCLILFIVLKEYFILQAISITLLITLTTLLYYIFENLLISEYINCYEYNNSKVIRDYDYYHIESENNDQTFDDYNDESKNKKIGVNDFYNNLEN